MSASPRVAVPVLLGLWIAAVASPAAAQQSSMLSAVIGAGWSSPETTMDLSPGTVQPVTLDELEFLPDGMDFDTDYGIRDSHGRPWRFQVMPPGLLYKSYLAGTQEPRFSTAFLYNRHRGWVWDNTIGGRVGMLRYGSEGAIRPEGWQLDIEGAAICRLDVENRDDLESVDFRFGTPFSWREGPVAVKFGYYHVSSHVGDEFLIRVPYHHRLNYVRDSLILGLSYDLTEDVRAYGEVAWAFSYDGGARPWEVQFGSEYSPARPTGLQAVPFAAINGHLRQELRFGGNLNIIAGWQWRSDTTDRLFRFGFQYFNGKSNQYSFYNEHLELTGLGLWFDY